jgi:prepilin-type N-terminal cleavage/methylation domain-containing protein
MMGKTNTRSGFTIVELLIVIVVIGILAAITIVAYSGIQDRAQTATLMSDLDNASKQLKIDQTLNSAYPATTDLANNGQGLKSSQGVTYRYSVNNSSSPQTFCLAALYGSSIYMTTQSTTPASGSCVNIALGVSSSNVLLTDGSTASTPYYNMTSGLQSVSVDLGSAQDVSMVKVWHYYLDARAYYNTKTEVSDNGTNWYTVFDSAVSGTYAETLSGKTSTFLMRKVRYIRDWLNGSPVNAFNHWVEIQAY